MNSNSALVTDDFTDLLNFQEIGRLVIYNRGFSAAAQNDVHRLTTALRYRPFMRAIDVSALHTSTIELRQRAVIRLGTLGLTSKMVHPWKSPAQALPHLFDNGNAEGLYPWKKPTMTLPELFAGQNADALVEELEAAFTAAFKIFSRDKLRVEFRTDVQRKPGDLHIHFSPVFAINGSIPSTEFIDHYKVFSGEGNEGSINFKYDNNRPDKTSRDKILLEKHKLHSVPVGSWSIINPLHYHRTPAGGFWPWFIGQRRFFAAVYPELD